MNVLTTREAGERLQQPEWMIRHVVGRLGQPADKRTAYGQRTHTRAEDNKPNRDDIVPLHPVVVDQMS